MGLHERVDAAIDAALVNRIVGCVVLISRGGQLTYARAAGLADREAGRPMTLDQIFRLASVTKPVVATTILRMSDLGLLSVEDPVTKFLPWFTPKTTDGLTPVIRIRDLLTHTSGITYDVPANVSPGMSGPIQSLEQNLKNLAAAPLAFAPGTAWAYGMSIDVLGGVAAAINGSSLEEAVVRHVAGPLGMTNWGFHVADESRLAVPYGDGRPPIRMADPQIVIDDQGGKTTFSPGRIFNRAAPQSGGGGSAGTAWDVLKLLEIYNGAGALLKPETVRQALANQIGVIPRRESDAGKRFGFIGAVLDDPKAAKNPCPAGTVDWGGAWGHNWVVDAANKLTIVVCTNTAFEGCNGPFREEILDAVYA
jgi:CubicO group peptidase (beta-lactamase class C family)